MSYRRNQNRKTWRKHGRWFTATPEMLAAALAEVQHYYATRPIA